MDITKVAGQTHPSSSYQPARPAALPTASAAASEAAARAAASSAPGSHRRLGLDSERRNNRPRAVTAAASEKEPIAPHAAAFCAKNLIEKFPRFSRSGEKECPSDARTPIHQPFVQMLRS